MNSTELAKSYNKIASKWNGDMSDSNYGVELLQRAIQYCSSKRNTLDVGCGSGGRMIDEILAANFKVTGIDISSEMLRLARVAHPNVKFIEADVVEWETSEKFDLIVAWDSIFHLPVAAHRPVLKKLCSLLRPQGILLYTLGDATDQHLDTWHGEKFCYGSIGVTANLKVIADSNCECRHLELDQFPNGHVSIIAKKN